MKNFKLFFFKIFLVTAVAAFSVSCEDGEDGLNGTDGIDGQNDVDGQDGEDGEDFVIEPTIFADKSPTPPLVALKPQFNYVEAYSLISTPETI